MGTIQWGFHPKAVLTMAPRPTDTHVVDQPQVFAKSVVIQSFLSAGTPPPGREAARGSGSLTSHKQSGLT